jgi:thioesterase domain-containing protein
MLVKVQPSGTKPPLYFIHGILGIMPLGRFLAHALGPDQPLYAICATGFDGRTTVENDETTIMEMAHTYVEEILETRPSGPVFVGGMCAGGLVALEVARELQARGQTVGPVILADPPATPYGLNPHYQTVNAQDPLVRSQLYQRVRGQLMDHSSQYYNDMPFAAGNEQQVHLATLAGIRTMVASCRHVPVEIYSGSAAAILSSQRAPGFLHPEMPWSNLLTGKKAIHVLPYSHFDLFRSGRHDFSRLLKTILDGGMDVGTTSERPPQRA